jgi:L-alanine-DL-glutamate epimerase-like enolase superfamily enzyme
MKTISDDSVSPAYAITDFDIWHVRVPLKVVMRSSRGGLDVGEKVILRLRTRSGDIGLGEASVIFPGRSGENAATIFVALRDIYGPMLLGKNPVHLARILDSCEAQTSEEFAFLATKCAIDIALHDLKARILGISVADLLGGSARRYIALSRSISIMPDDELIKTAVHLGEEGYRLLTLKGTKDWRGNIKSYEKVRKAIPDHVDIEFDPNQAWTVKETLAVDRALAGQRLTCIEQPNAWWDLEGLRSITERCTALIAADEAVLSQADAMRVIKMGAADLITVKLAKSGGIRASAMIVEAARFAGLACNMGSKHPFGIGTAALLHFAAAYPDVGEFIGYGSARELFVGDIIQETITIENGCAAVPDGIGLGVSLNDAVLQQFTVAHYSSRRVQSRHDTNLSR